MANALRPLTTAVVVALAGYLARAGLKRWVDGPEPVPSPEPWTLAPGRRGAASP